MPLPRNSGSAPRLSSTHLAGHKRRNQLYYDLTAAQTRVATCRKKIREKAKAAFGVSNFTSIYASLKYFLGRSRWHSSYVAMVEQEVAHHLKSPLLVTHVDTSN